MSRIYLVKDNVNNEQILVRAGNPAQALRVVSAKAFTVKLATTDEALTAQAAGAKIVEAEAEDKQRPAPPAEAEIGE